SNQNLRKQKQFSRHHFDFKSIKMTLKIMGWNANGFSSHSPEFLEFLNVAIHLPDILCIQETHFHLGNCIEIKGYNSVHNFRKIRRGGGVSMYIKSGLNFSVVQN